MRHVQISNCENDNILCLADLSVYIPMAGDLLAGKISTSDATGRCTFSAARSIDGAESYEESSTVELPPPDYPRLDPATADTLQIDRRIDSDPVRGSCHSC